MSAAFDLCTFCCVTLGKGTMGGVNGNAFVNDLPNIPDNVNCAVFEYGGGRSGLGMRSAVQGTHNGGNDGAKLIDTTKNFSALGVGIGDLVRNLTDGSVGLVTAISTTTNSNDTITVTLTGGTGNDFDTGDLCTIDIDPDALENVNCQIRVRNSNATTAHATIYSIYKSMDGLGGVTINSVSYLFFRAKQPPFFLLRDGNNRTTFAVNFEIEKRRS